MTLARTSAYGLDEISHRAAGVAIDYIDTNVEKAWSPVADLHIACSYAQVPRLTRVVTSNGQTDDHVFLLPHHADIHLQPNYAGRKIRAVPQIAYIGARNNTVLSPEIESEIYIPEFEKDAEFHQIIDAIQDAEVHYAVRDMRRPVEARRFFKPFTKGFTAAAVGSNVLVNSETDDAIEYLSDDYPFLIPSISESDIREGIALVRESYRSSEWLRGLSIMEDVRNRVSPPKIAMALEQMLQKLQDIS